MTRPLVSSVSLLIVALSATTVSMQSLQRQLEITLIAAPLCMCKYNLASHGAGQHKVNQCDDCNNHCCWNVVLYETQTDIHSKHMSASAGAASLKRSCQWSCSWLKGCSVATTLTSRRQPPQTLTAALVSTIKCVGSRVQQSALRHTTHERMEVHVVAQMVVCFALQHQ